jgi:hypothetical protein
MRYRISCRGCDTPIGETNDPRQAYDLASETTDHDAKVVARGMVNSVRFNRANRDREVERDEP